MKTIYHVILDDDTTGTIDSDTLDGQAADNFLGEVMRAKSRDENGMTIEVDGVLTDVLYHVTY
jgi:hypothetical protein